MRHLFLIASLALLLASCKLMPKNQPAEQHNTGGNNKEFARLLDDYYAGQMRLSPLLATQNGEDRYNDLLPAEFTDNYRDSLKKFYMSFRDELIRLDPSTLNENDGLSYAILGWEVRTRLDGLNYHSNYIPFNQFYALPLTLGQLGSGEGFQPFRTLKDHEDWIRRANAFGPWVDSAIVYFRKGMDSGFVLPRTLVLKIIPQMEAMVTDKPEKSLFYGPVAKLKDFTDTAAVKNLREAYVKLISRELVPAYKKLADFLKNEYLAKARNSSGIGSLPNGDAYYAYLVRDQTTTSKSPAEIYETGLNEVARIRKNMDSVRKLVGFKGDLPAFFSYMRTDKKFTPYKTPGEVLAAFETIHQTMQPQLKKMFNHTPKTGFEIRQTEAFRAASASAEYNQGSADGKRPGIFYIPILDATRFNTTSGMESLFLHEAIPGHHYQISLQQEDTLLPSFRRFGGNNAYQEGWALYCESLGKELGLYTDPYQYMGSLGDEIHRAIRLVVDVAIHTKGMTREEAIKYMMDNEAISEEGATAEIERYMAIPGQALGYKIGALKIRALRNKYQADLKDKFRLADFHDEILKDGCMPLEVLEKKMDGWEKKIQ
ncbi:DUF885 domain-containing protein [Flavitalea flava]